MLQLMYSLQPSSCSTDKEYIWSQNSNLSVVNGKIYCKYIITISMSSVNNMYTMQLNRAQIKIKCIHTSNTLIITLSFLSVKSENAQ